MPPAPGITASPNRAPPPAGASSAVATCLPCAVVSTIFPSPPFTGRTSPFILETKIIGSGFPEENDPAALIIGPTGVALGGGDTLYVADSVGNRVAWISHASFRHSSGGTGQTVSAGGALMTPLGLTLAPNELL